MSMKLLREREALLKMKKKLLEETEKVDIVANKTYATMEVPYIDRDDVNDARIATLVCESYRGCSRTVYGEHLNRKKYLVTPLNFMSQVPKSLLSGIKNLEDDYEKIYQQVFLEDTKYNCEEFHFASYNSKALALLALMSYIYDIDYKRDHFLIVKSKRPELSFESRSVPIYIHGLVQEIACMDFDFPDKVALVDKLYFAIMEATSVTNIPLCISMLLSVAPEKLGTLIKFGYCDGYLDSFSRIVGYDVTVDRYPSSVKEENQNNMAYTCLIEEVSQNDDIEIENEPDEFLKANNSVIVSSLDFNDCEIAQSNDQNYSIKFFMSMMESYNGHHIRKLQLNQQEQCSSPSLFSDDEYDKRSSYNNYIGVFLPPEILNQNRFEFELMNFGFLDNLHSSGYYEYTRFKEEYKQILSSAGPRTLILFYGLKNDYDLKWFMREINTKSVAVLLVWNSISSSKMRDMCDVISTYPYHMLASRVYAKPSVFSYAFFRPSIREKRQDLEELEFSYRIFEDKSFITSTGNFCNCLKDMLKFSTNGRFDKAVHDVVFKNVKSLILTMEKAKTKRSYQSCEERSIQFNKTNILRAKRRKRRSRR